MGQGREGRLQHHGCLEFSWLGNSGSQCGALPQSHHAHRGQIAGVFYLLSSWQSLVRAAPRQGSLSLIYSLPSAQEEDILLHQGPSGRWNLGQCALPW